MSGLADDEFYVEDILDTRQSGASVEYLVKWSEGDPTWEPAKNVVPSCQGLIDTLMAKVRFFVFDGQIPFLLQNIICNFFYILCSLKCFER